MEQIPAAPVAKRRWGIWKWILIASGASLLLCSGLIAGIFGLVSSSFKSVGFYDEAIAEAQKDPRVIEKLGTPIEKGLIPAGSINSSGDGTGTADLKIPVSGPKGVGLVEVKANREGGKWQVHHLVVVIQSTGEFIDLRPDAPTPTPPSTVERTD